MVWRLFLRFDISDELFVSFDLIQRNCLQFVGKVLVAALEIDIEKKQQVTLDLS